jgi:hypothetical protein
MKQYEILAENYIYDEDPHSVYTTADLRKAYIRGFLEARTFACKHGFYETVKEMQEAMEELGEREE